MTEVWKEIPDFPDYKISTLGNIMSKKSGDWRKKNPGSDKDGYLRTELVDKNKKGKTCRINRLMGLTFLPNPDNLPTVDHIDQNKTNNNLSNLRWATYKTQAMNRTITRHDITETDPKKRQYIIHKESFQRIKDEARYPCHTCYMTFGCQTAYEIHLTSKSHIRILNFKPTTDHYCRTCGVSFEYPSELERHYTRQNHKKKMALKDSSQN